MSRLSALFGTALVAATLAAAIPASAARHHATPIPADTPQHRAGSLSPPGCILGVQGSPGLLVDLFPGDDAYFTLLRPSICGACSLTTLANVHIWLEFRNACTAPVSITCVKVGGTTCPFPDLAHPLFVSVDTALVGDAGINEFIVPVPSNWKLLDNAFLCVRFTAADSNCNLNTNAPRLVERVGCVRCESYGYGAGMLSDTCDGAGAPLLSAEISECVLTPARPRSWGSLKILYR